MCISTNARRSKAIECAAVEIHRLTVDDGPRLRTIRLRALRDAPDAFGTTFEESVVWPEASWTSQLAKLATFVASRDGADIGMVRGAAHADIADAAMLLSMWVAPEARGQGVGDALVGAVVAWARGQGFRTLLLDVADTNAPAIAFYARLGFVPNGVVSTLPPPRQLIGEHQRALDLSPPSREHEPEGREKGLDRSRTNSGPRGSDGSKGSS